MGWVRKGDCPPELCQGRCCEHVGMWLAKDATAFVQTLRTRGIIVKEFPSEPCYLVRFDQRCQHLTDAGLCGIYGKPERPQFCSDWPQEPAQLINDEQCGFTFEWEPEGATIRG